MYHVEKGHSPKGWATHKGVTVWFVKHTDPKKEEFWRETFQEAAELCSAMNKFEKYPDMPIKEILDIRVR